MSNKHIRLIHYFRKTLTYCKDIDNKVVELTQKFPAFENMIIDLYILKKEQRLHTHKTQKQKYKYETFNSTRKTQAEIINKIKDNIR